MLEFIKRSIREHKAMLREVLQQLSSHAHALRLLVLRDLSGRYKGTMFGGLWLLLQPLMMVVVYSFVFSVIMKVKVPGAIDNPYHFAVYLMAALMPYMAFQEAVMTASSSLFANAALLQRSTMPPVLFPLIPVLSTVVTETIALIIIIIAAKMLLDQFSVSLLALPFLVAVRLIVSLAFAYIVAILAVFVQDLRQALGLLLTVLMFLTPIVYPVDMVPAEFTTMNDLNPFYHLTDAYRAVILRDELPDYGFYIVLLFATLALVLALGFFQKTVALTKDFV